MDRQIPRQSQSDPHGADTSSRMDPLPSADAPSNRAARRRTSRNAPSDVQGDTNAPTTEHGSIDALDYTQTKAAIAETQARLNTLTDHRTSLEVAYKRGTHWRDVVGSAFTSDDGVRVAWLSGSRLINLSGVDSTQRDNVRNDEPNRVTGRSTARGVGDGHEGGIVHDPRTGEGRERLNLHDDNIHEHRTGEGGLIVEGGVSRTVPRTSVDHEHTVNLGAFKSHVDARRLTISVNGKIYNHVDETPDGHWVYRFDK